MNRSITQGHRLSSALLLIALASPFAAQAAKTDEAEQQSPAADADAADTQQQLLKPKSRLRFRGNGPTCMCADGLREKDIRAAKPRSNDDTETQSTDP